MELELEPITDELIAKLTGGVSILVLMELELEQKIFIKLQSL